MQEITILNKLVMIEMGFWSL